MSAKSESESVKSTQRPSQERVRSNQSLSQRKARVKGEYFTVNQNQPVSDGDFQSQPETVEVSRSHPELVGCSQCRPIPKEGR